MTFKWLKSILPKGLYGRTALILLVPVITIQFVVSIVFIQRHFDGVTRQMAESLTLEVGLILDRINGAEGLGYIAKIDRAIAEPLGYALSAVKPGTPLAPDSLAFDDLTGQNVITTLRKRVPSIRSVDLLTNPHLVALTLETRHGLVKLSFNRSRASAAAPHQLLVLMIVISLLMTLISIIFLRNQIRPIRRLARAAEAFGRGRNIAYRVSGATEVRAAGQAFLDMRARIEHHIEQRTLMLSGVSHDLRTPLTRLKLGLSLTETNEETAGLIRDVDDMEVMLDEFLAFARGDSRETTTPTDPAALLAQVCGGLRRDTTALELVLPDADCALAPFNMRPNAVRRALENLVNNALRYGNRCRVTLGQSDKMAFFTVEDDGPGIPPAQREQALRPFIRLDAARNQDHGTGVGLGLSIVMDIASSHGGVLDLGDSQALGGLKVVLGLPR